MQKIVDLEKKYLLISDNSKKKKKRHLPCLVKVSIFLTNPFTNKKAPWKVHFPYNEPRDLMLELKHAPSYPTGDGEQLATILSFP